MNLAEYFESQENRKAFWLRCGLAHFDNEMPGWYSKEGELQGVANPLSDDVKLEVLVDLWNQKTMRSQSSRKFWYSLQGLSSKALREALVSALMEE